ncbi:hypothetical protein KNP414_05623 [Paenibacillus mucilaginosus KNP414]|uniref:Uncharacterized protein n=1 Tax=Paenibacillus mucilaginosus (strain KNP414) TaxID=1036673 RepID=F8FLM0_PAEMK|nr:hypothetical protein KNP414_05623 [Paenibacillus mucilaginosus KNP414]
MTRLASNGAGRLVCAAVVTSFPMAVLEQPPLQDTMKMNKE